MSTLYSSGSAWENKLGYSRAVQVGDTLYISATSAAAADGSVTGDLYEQTRFALEKLGAVLAEAGFGYEHVEVGGQHTKVGAADVVHVQLWRPPRAEPLRDRSEDQIHAVRLIP